MIYAMHQPLEVLKDDRLAVVTLRGELDAHDAPRLRELFAGAIGELAAIAEPRLVLDLTAVSFIDSTALGSIIGAVRRIREAGGELTLVLPSSPARRIFEITGLDTILSVHSTRAEALAG
jgi:anti-sigma B factor antagonist